MRFVDTVRTALKAMRVNGLRSALTCLGVIIGVASVVMMVAVGAGTQAQIREEIERTGTNIVLIMPGTPASAGPSAVTRPLTDEDAEALSREAYTVAAAAPSVSGLQQLTSGLGTSSSALYGVTEEFFLARNWQLASGRMVVQEDVESSAQVVMLGASVAKRLFEEEDPVGQTLRINQMSAQVIGVLQPKGRSMDGNDDDDIALVPITTAREQLVGRNVGTSRSVGMITVKFHDSERVQEGIEEVRDILRFQHRLGPDQPDTFRIHNVAEMLKLQQDSSEALTRLLASIASISLLVGGIGIMNIMLVTVTERTKEIGLRMAIGASPAVIRGQFLTEATVLSLSGGIIGAVTGVSGALLLQKQFLMRVAVTWEPLLLAFGFSAFVGLVFGIYPAVKASRRSPLEALRQE